MCYKYSTGLMYIYWSWTLYKTGQYVFGFFIVLDRAFGSNVKVILLDFFLSKLWEVEINVESRVHICYLSCNVSVHRFIIAQKQGALYLKIIRNLIDLFLNFCSGDCSMFPNFRNADLVFWPHLVEECACQTFLLIPKRNGDSCGIDLVKLIRKTVTGFLKRRLTAKIQFLENLHGLHTRKGTGTVSI